MKLKLLASLITIAFFFKNSYSQTTALQNPEYTVHSPNVTSLGKYGEYPVDLSTGVPKIEIPLYTIKSGRLTLPISVSYHASGIKVDQESSFVGLGWVLNAGGVITRVLKDRPDEEQYGFLETGDILPDYNDINNDLPSGNTGYSNELEIWSRKKDKEPDVFTINSSLLSGQFVLDNTLQFISTHYKSLDYSINLIQNKMVITDENGTVFQFGKSLTNDEAFETTSTTYSLDGGGLNTKTYNSSWYLTEIISPDRSDTISLKYKMSHYTRGKIGNIKRQELVDPLLSTTDKIGQEFNLTSSTYMETNIGNTRVLDSILFKNGYVVFSSLRDRIDVNGVIPEELTIPRVTGFSVFNKNNDLIKKIVLDNNAYFNRTGNGASINNMPISETSIRKKSLKLNGVKFYDKNNVFVNDYKLEYNEEVALAPFNTTSQDYWGYYNGKNNSSMIPTKLRTRLSGRPYYIGEDRSSDGYYMKAAILNKITFPTGGYSKYEYEPHYYLVQEQKENKAQKEKKISLFAINRLNTCPSDFLNGVPSYNSIEFEAESEVGNGNYDAGELFVMFSDYKFTTGQSMIVRFTDLTNPSPGNIYYFEHTPSNKNEIMTFTSLVGIRKGHRYRIEADINGVSGSNTSICDSPFIEIGLSYKYWVTASKEEIKPKEAGGLRVKSITNYDFNNAPITKKMYSYGDKQYGPNKLGTGTLITDPSLNFYYYPLLYTYSEGSKGLRNLLWYSSNSQVELGFNNGSTVDYNKVTEQIVSYNSNTVTNGKTEYYYSPTGRDPDYRYMRQNSPYNAFTYPSWKKSTLDSILYHKQLGNETYSLVKSISYEYNTLPEKRIKTFSVINNEPYLYVASRPGGVGSWFYLQDNPNTYYYLNTYYSCGRKTKSKEIVKEYKNGIETNINTTNYYYENFNHLQPTTISLINSKEELLTTKITYPQDLASPTIAEQDLITRHQLTLPIKTESFRKLGTNPNEILSAKYTIYNNLKWPGLNLPEFIQSSKGSGALKDRITYHDYYANGNIKEISKKNGTSTYYIWGYNKEHLIAKIENFTSAQAISIQNKINTAITASNADNDRTIDTITIEQVIYIGNEGVLRAALSALRNDPTLTNAMIATYTYDPLIGVTSITDARGQTIYYEYDNFNRFKAVKDATGNLISDTNYHFKNQ